MKAQYLLPAVLAGATLILLGANAIPTTIRRKRLERELGRLSEKLEREHERGAWLRVEIDALRHDAFYLERMLIETWNGIPDGAQAWTPPDLDGDVTDSMEE